MHHVTVVWASAELAGPRLAERMHEELGEELIGHVSWGLERHPVLVGLIDTGAMSVSDMERFRDAERPLDRTDASLRSRQIDAGACANLSGVVRAGLRLLMACDGARQFCSLKAESEAAAREAEGGGFEEFDPLAYEPGVGSR